MAASTAPRFDLPTCTIEKELIPMATSVTLYGGIFVCVDANGKLNAAADTSGLVLYGQIPGSGTYVQSASLLNAPVIPYAEIKYAELYMTSPAQSIVGQKVYFTDDHTVAASSTNSILAGRVVKVSVTGTSGKVVVLLAAV